jgi:glucoamylase
VLALAVADGENFFSWEQDDTDSEVVALETGVPAFRLSNRCRQGRYRIEKEVYSHPDRPAIIQRVRFFPSGSTNFQLYALLNPHLGSKGEGWLGDYKGVTMLFACGDGAAVALACSSPWLQRSVGFVGKSGGLQDLSEHKSLTWHYDRATAGNVQLVGEIDYQRNGGEFLLVLGFGLDPDAAGLNARAALLDGFREPSTRFIAAWQDWQAHLNDLAGKTEQTATVYRTSTAVLRTHEAKLPPGAAVASLAIPFGQARSGADTGGYHLIWPRDLVEIAGGLLAAGAYRHPQATLAFLQATQEPDGHWAQNMWANGKPYWTGIQMDETAEVILLLNLVRRENAFKKEAGERFWPMVRKAAGYLVQNGPITPEDRWEQDGGYSPYTLATEVAALLIAAELALEHGEETLALYLQETADIWNASIEKWTYVTGTELAKRVGVEGYYIRLGQPREKGKSSGSDSRDAAQESSVSPDALGLVRFGLRKANDPRILNTVKTIDAVLKVELGYGPGWHRYQGDKYGEYPDGSAYNKKGGVGRVWPLFAGERGHYELAAGRPKQAEQMLHLMESMATATGLISEQVWDSDDIPDKDLFRGRPTTSACPLVWAHAEYIKLLRSLRDGAVFDLPPQTVGRYGNGFSAPRVSIWRWDHSISKLAVRNRLRIELPAPATVIWSTDRWRIKNEVKTHDTGIGIHVADLATESLPLDSEIVFTFNWTRIGWSEDTEFRIAVEGSN